MVVITIKSTKIIRYHIQLSIEMSNQEVDSHYMTPNPTDTIGVPSNITSIYSPASIYLIICFFCVLTIIIFRSSLYSIPSIVTMTALSMIMLTSCAALFVLANVSIAAEWACLIISTLFLLLTTYAILVPTVFFYPTLS